MVDSNGRDCADCTIAICERGVLGQFVHNVGYCQWNFVVCVPKRDGRAWIVVLKPLYQV